jgi:DNA topoisomerase-3
MVGKQEMVGAIDAVCDVAERIIGKLKEGAAAEGTPLLGAAVSNSAGERPPTPAMKRFADRLARQTGIKPPPGYTTSMSICRAFLDQHAPKKVQGESGGHDAKAGRPTHTIPEETARDGDVGCPTEASVNLPAAPELTDANPVAKRRRRVRRTTSKPNVSTAPKSTAVKKRSARRKAGVSAPPTAPRRSPETVTPLRIPYGNKEVALRLGAHYGARGWYAPPGVDLSAFVERGWL